MIRDGVGAAQTFCVHSWPEELEDTTKRCPYCEIVKLQKEIKWLRYAFVNITSSDECHCDPDENWICSYCTAVMALNGSEDEVVRLLKLELLERTEVAR